VKKRSLKGLIFVISGPSGSGKTTLLKKALLDKGLKSKFAKSVSLTTRKKRSGEREGRDYFFVSRDLFQKLLKHKKILEWTRYLGYYYGTKKDFVEEKLAQGKNLALCLDLKGAQALKKLYPKNTVTIFIIPPSISELRKRIEKRCSKIEEKEIVGRLNIAAKELKGLKFYDYSVRNENLNKAVSRLKEIIFNHLSLINSGR
jgi:guanylate kinase